MFWGFDPPRLATSSTKLGIVANVQPNIRDQQTEKRIAAIVALGGNGSEKALIDTGANISLIHSDLIGQHSFQLRPFNCSFISSFGTGNVIAARGCCNIVLTFLGLQMKPMQFLVIDAQELRNYRVVVPSGDAEGIPVQWYAPDSSL